MLMLIVEFVILKKKSHKFILFSLIIQEKSPPLKIFVSGTYFASNQP